MIPSSKQQPCPVCGRTKDGDCRVNDAGLVLCHTHGQDATPGDPSPNGRYRFLKTSTEAQGFGIWKPAEQWDDRPGRGKQHQPARLTTTSTAAMATPLSLALPADASTITLAALPAPAAQPPEHWPDGQRLDYSPTQQVVVTVSADGKKQHRPQHRLTPDAPWIPRAGSDPWPFWHQDDAITHGRGNWIFEAEGEKCAAWIRAAGFACVTHPGHNHSDQPNQARYKALQQAGVRGVVCLADHDTKGQEKACKCLSAASAAGLPFLVVHAADVWPDLPTGGSIDDASGTPAERVQQLVEALPDAIQQQQQQTSHQANDPQTLLKQLRQLAADLLQKRTPVYERTALIRAAANANGLSLRDGEIFALVAEARRKLQGKTSAIESDDEFDIPDDTWAWDQVIPAAAPTLLIALQKVGKTALLAGMVAAWHYDAKSYLGFPLVGPCPPVIVAGTDQTIADWFRVLEPAGLMGRNPETGKARLTPGGPIKKLWHRSQPIYLDMAGIEELERACEQNPGALLICDTYAALVAPLGLDEAKPEAAEPLYNLMEVIERHGTTLVLIHHASKSRANERASNASRNSNAIPAAVSQIISLQWLEPDKKGDQRINLTTEGRNSKPVDLVIEQVDRSQWVSHGSTDEIRRTRQLEKVEANLSDRQTDALEAVREDWDCNREMTAIRLVELLPDQFDTPRKARATLSQLVEKGLVTKRNDIEPKAGGTVIKYRPAKTKPSPSRGGVQNNPPQPPQVPQVSKASQRFEPPPLTTCLKPEEAAEAEEGESRAPRARAGGTSSAEGTSSVLAEPSPAPADLLARHQHHLQTRPVTGRTAPLADDLAAFLNSTQPSPLPTDQDDTQQPIQQDTLAGSGDPADARLSHDSSEPDPLLEQLLTSNTWLLLEQVLWTPSPAHPLDQPQSTDSMPALDPIAWAAALPPHKQASLQLHLKHPDKIPAALLNDIYGEIRRQALDSKWPDSFDGRALKAFLQSPEAQAWITAQPQQEAA